jgi:hypothetical protein
MAIYKPDPRAGAKSPALFQSDESDTTLRFSECNHSISTVHVLPSNPKIDTATRTITNPSLCIICSAIQTEKRASLAKGKYDSLRRFKCIELNAKLWNMDDEEEKEGVMRAFENAFSTSDIAMEKELNEFWRPFVEVWGDAMKTTTREVLHLSLEKKNAKKRVVGEWKGVNEDDGTKR